MLLLNVYLHIIITYIIIIVIDYKILDILLDNEYIICSKYMYKCISQFQSILLLIYLFYLFIFIGLMLDIIKRYNKDSNYYYFGLLFGLAISEPKYRQSLQNRIKAIGFQKTIVDSIRDDYVLVLSSIFIYIFLFFLFLSLFFFISSYLSSSFLIFFFSFYRS